MKPFSIGIDPGKNTGIAIYNRPEKKISSVHTLSFWDAIDMLMEYKPKDVHRVIIELSETKHVWHNQAANRGAIEKTAVNVGMVLRESQLLVEHFIRNGYDVVTQKPQGKLDAEDVKKITGFNGSTNPHTRDAIMLVWGV